MYTENFGEWIKNKSIAETKLFLSNDGYIIGRDNADTADLNVLKINANDQAEFGILPIYQGVIDAATPIKALVTKEYVLNVLAGLRDPKDGCRVASIGNVNIASAPVSIDGVNLAAGERILLKNQTNPVENGIYTYPVGGATNPMVRSTDADEDAEVTQGLATIIAEGSVNARRQYLLTTNDPIVVGTTALTFVRIPNPADLVIQQQEVLDLLALDLDINGYKDLTVGALYPSMQVIPKGGPQQESGIDFTLSDVGGVTRITFGLSGTVGTLGEKLKEILTNHGSSKLVVHYERLAN